MPLRSRHEEGQNTVLEEVNTKGFFRVLFRSLVVKEGEREYNVERGVADEG